MISILENIENNFKTGDCLTYVKGDSMLKDVTDYMYKNYSNREYKYAVYLNCSWNKEHIIKMLSKAPDNIIEFLENEKYIIRPEKVYYDDVVLYFFTAKFKNILINNLSKTDKEKFGYVNNYL